MSDSVRVTLRSSELSDHEKMKAMLKPLIDAGKLRVEEMDRKDGGYSLYIEGGGYAGFCSEMVFDADGKLTGVNAWE